MTMSDQTDASFFSTFFKPGVSEDVISSKIPICAKYDDFYNLQHAKRGIAIILNHQIFDNKQQQPRDGTDKDEKRLEVVLSKLEFEIRCYNDLSFGEISHVLQQASEEDHSHNDCLLVCVMSHGEEGKIYARDYGYPPDLLWEPFVGGSCTTLNGKPKLFFIQACRGDQVDAGVTVKSREQTDSSTIREDVYQIPAMADILVMYSTYNGYYSWRSPSKGSWFIQSLCEIFEKYGSERDLLSLLTMVNRKVALDFQSYVPAASNLHKKKQVCTIVSMLTRLMAFPAKNNYIKS